jgi:signal recognition particle receptor subunit beta
MAYANRGKFHISDSVQYFFDKAIQFAGGVNNVPYEPTVEDILRVRQPTTAVIEEKYWVDQTLVKLVDVGGQKNERRRWIDCFEGVTAVIFVANLADYDVVGEDDPSTNKLTESLELFAEVVHSPWFEDSTIILFLNKQDLFKQKIATSDLRYDGDKHTPARFLDYSGAPRDAAASLQYIQRRFLELAGARPAGARPVMVHFTTAIETNKTKTVIKACKEHILKENLSRIDD